MRKRNVCSCAIFYTFLTSACGIYKPTARLVINNDGVNAVPLQVSITKLGENNPSHILKETLQPGIHEIPAGRFQKGLYFVTAETGTGSVKQTKPVSLDTDRWIIINYLDNDSATIQRRYGYIDTSYLKKNGERFSGIDLFTENRMLPTLLKSNTKNNQSPDR